MYNMVELILSILYVLLTLLSVFFAWKLMYAFKHFKMKRLLSEPSMLRDMPSVSVCIPARNETAAMSQCLEKVIASTYPKLEIIVLDDDSADNTSYLIKSFAHAGVRFVEGSPLPDGWVGKNHALQGLLDEASGSLVLYMDVDTQIQPDTIEQLVSYMRQERASMISVLPLRTDNWRTSVLFGSMRYFWELILHRSRKPAVASSAWMINRQLLIDEFGGFNTIKNVIQPESSLAAHFAEKKAYSFLIGTPLLGVSFEKKWLSQVDTSIRLLYPIVGGRLFKGLIAALILILLNLPTFFVIDGFFDGWTVIQIAASWQLCVFVAIYALYLDTVWKRGWWVGALLWPYIIAQEFILLVFSIVGYLRHSITWKGRSVIASATSLRAK
ncbi:glycosyltransferase [Patescibacteria group bacterium]|nr:MAG: glycosyltransferase [Patescibacteria group bacterium]